MRSSRWMLQKTDSCFCFQGRNWSVSAELVYCYLVIYFVILKFNKVSFLHVYIKVIICFIPKILNGWGAILKKIYKVITERLALYQKMWIYWYEICVQNLALLSLSEQVSSFRVLIGWNIIGLLLTQKLMWCVVVMYVQSTNSHYLIKFLLLWEPRKMAAESS